MPVDSTVRYSGLNSWASSLSLKEAAPFIRWHYSLNKSILRENTHSRHVFCTEKDGDSAFDDCRQIEEIGYLAPTLRLKSGQVAAI